MIEYADSEIITLWLPGRVVPKARPRLGKYGVFMPEDYRIWKRDAIALIQERWRQLELRTIIEPLSCSAIIVGDARGDGDNILGSIQDALVEAGAIANDGLNRLPKASIEYQTSRTLKGVWIEIDTHKIKKFNPVGKFRLREKAGRYTA